VEVCGKLVRRRLKTGVYSKALLRLSDFLTTQVSAPPRSANAPTAFAEGWVRSEKALKARHDMQPRAKVYRQGCIKALRKTWPGLDAKYDWSRTEHQVAFRSEAD
jgi:hypothetical protein